MDFHFEDTADWRRLKFLNLIDEPNRLCLAIRVGRRGLAKVVVAVLVEFTSLYSAREFVCSDKGDEFIGHALSGSSKENAITTDYNVIASP